MFEMRDGEVAGAAGVFFGDEDRAVAGNVREGGRWEGAGGGEPAEEAWVGCVSYEEVGGSGWRLDLPSSVVKPCSNRS